MHTILGEKKQYFHLQNCVLDFVFLVWPEFVEPECRKLNQSRYRGGIINVDKYLALKVEVFSYDESSVEETVKMYNFAVHKIKHIQSLNQKCHPCMKM